MLYVVFGFVLRQSCKRLIDAADGLVYLQKMHECLEEVYAWIYYLFVY
jgi:hypothetical protein